MSLSPRFNPFSNQLDWVGDLQETTDIGASTTNAISISTGATNPALTVDVTTGANVHMMDYKLSGSIGFYDGTLFGLAGRLFPSGGVNFWGEESVDIYIVLNGITNDISLNSIATIGLNAPTINITGDTTILDGKNINVGTTNGTIIATDATQLLGFFGASPIVQQSGSLDLSSILNKFGFIDNQNVYSITTSGAVNLTGGLTISSTLLTITDVNVVLSTTTGTKFGTDTTQKLSFYNATPIVRPTATTDLGTVLSNLGLRAAGTAYPLSTSGAVSFSGTSGLSGTWTISGSGGQFTTNNFTIRDVSVALATTTGTSFGTATTQKLSFYGLTPIVQPGATTDLGTVLSNLGLRASGTAYPITTSGAVVLTASAGGTTSGQIWNDSTQKTFTTYESGVKQYMEGALFTQTADATVGNTVTETSILGTGVGTKTLPANFFVAGKTLRFVVRGYHSASASPTIRVKAKLGTTVILDTTAITSKNGTNDGWEARGEITCRTTGATGTVYGQGIYKEYQNPAIDGSMVNTATTTIDTTASNTFDVTITWGTAAVGNTITSTNFYLDVIN